MAAHFKKLMYNIADRMDAMSEIAPGFVTEAFTDEATADTVLAFGTDEEAARYYAERFISETEDADLLPAIGPDLPAVMPGLVRTRDEDLKRAETRTLHFGQQHRTVPIFGTNAVVEIDSGTRELVSFDAELTSEPDVDPIPYKSIPQAYASIQEATLHCPPLDTIDPPKLCYFAEAEGSQWHLTYHFKDVEAVPREVADVMTRSDGQHGHGLADVSPREVRLTYDYLVDAKDGQVVYFFSSGPTVVPVLCEGDDEVSVRRQFHGQTKNNTYILFDPQRNIVTFDHNFNDIQGPAPLAPIDNPSADFGSTATAGVSAHYHATLVFDFFNDVLKRKGIDDKGMRLESVVNCTYSAHGPGMAWRNAVWWKKRMWYGQSALPNGSYESFARYLDVIAHELTHGITETTSNLVYRDESGALNESFSDIFGVMVANWYPGEPNALANWNWEIGSGLGSNGGPMRDMSDPARTSHPDHWSKRKYLGTHHDNGGVHYNSNIHNKAAFNLFMEKNAAGDHVLSPDEIGLFYYYTLLRLGRRATLRDCRAALLSVAATYFRGLPARAREAADAIKAAYDKVGIL
ncbi:M4 family peptidase [Hwanghaeella grinnelliae]|uniref:Neutral metalloproteinase n=1 Tax=Hwanghaeella grinnelliae TaxID=2500179 RepID=A0A437QMW4_9PROT|nr:M4 family metallopeptidase [Hwanghaeella grinnelliae]RVU35760.1 M4 family peptidase [Hwanghaeella grinnelliae]